MFLSFTTIIIIVANLLLHGVLSHKNDLFNEFEKLILSNQGEFAEDKLRNSLLYGDDTPKEIEIFCPGPQSPVVTIRDIIRDFEENQDDNLDKKKCMTLKLTGSNFNFKLEVDCD
jgi:hypothetical protein